jgi:hypothetical protein
MYPNGSPCAARVPRSRETPSFNTSTELPSVAGAGGRLMMSHTPTGELDSSVGCVQLAPSDPGSRGPAPQAAVRPASRNAPDLERDSLASWRRGIAVPAGLECPSPMSHNNPRWPGWATIRRSHLLHSAELRREKRAQRCSGPGISHGEETTLTDKYQPRREGNSNGSNTNRRIIVTQG